MALHQFVLQFGRLRRRYANYRYGGGRKSLVSTYMCIDVFLAATHGNEYPYMNGKFSDHQK